MITKSPIELTSATYLRRMAREIRSNFQHGVYYEANAAGLNHNPRVTGVLFSNGMLHIKSHSWDG